MLAEDGSTENVELSRGEAPGMAKSSRRRAGGERARGPLKLGEEAGRIDSGRSEGCWKFFKGSRRGVGRVGMTGLKKCDAFFLIGGGAAVVISQRTWTESSAPFRRRSSFKRGFCRASSLLPGKFRRARARADSSISLSGAPRGCSRLFLLNPDRSVSLSRNACACGASCCTGITTKATL